MTRPRCWTAPMPTRKSSWVAFTSSTFPISTRRSPGRPAVPRRCTVSSRCVHSWIGLPTSASSGQRRCNRRTEQTMRKLLVFNQVSLDGYIADAHGDMRWAHKLDAEWNACAAENASGGGVLLLGRVSYDLMASYWPTPAALKNAPAVAEGDRKSTRLNSSHLGISYAVFCF